eukprot:14275833-Alexandrium_andersonii.AAC.2
MQRSNRGHILSRMALSEQLAGPWLHRPSAAGRIAPSCVDEARAVHRSGFCGQGRTLASEN